MKREFRPLEDALNFQVYKLSVLLSRGLTDALREYRLTPEKWQVLAVVWEAEGDVNQVQIGRVTLKDKPSVSRLVASMVEEGWLVRANDPADARAYCVHASAKALRKRDEIVRTLYEYFDPSMNALGQNDQQQLMALVKKYVDILQETSERQRHSKRVSWF